MDVVVHAVTGYAVGGIAGMIGAVVPDLPMLDYWRAPPSKEESPPWGYQLTHSLLFFVFGFIIIGPLFAAGMLTHLILDQVTHGRSFAPRWLFPHQWGFSPLEEWEEWKFLSTTWWIGVLVAVWIILAEKLFTLTGYLLSLDARLMEWLT